VPTTLARITDLGFHAGLADLQRVFEIGMRARDDVYRHELADPAGSGSSGIRRSLDGGDVAADDRGDVPGADLLPTDKGHFGGLDHRICRLDHGDESFGFDHAERLTHADLPGAL
jgi:hypothetical protein